MFEGVGPLPGEEAAIWATFEKRLADSLISLLTSAGIYLKDKQPSFDLEHEQTNPEWGDPSWRSIPAGYLPDDIGVAHLHINEEDVLADPEVALPAHLLDRLAAEGVIGSAAAEHLSLMGYQERNLDVWRDKTVHELVARLRDQGVDGLILAPA